MGDTFTSNVSCRLEAKLDLGVSCGWVEAGYADRGRSSVDPVVVFKFKVLQLVMFFEGVPPERQFITTASLSLAHHCYRSDALDEELPDLSRLILICHSRGVAARDRLHMVACRWLEESV